MEPTIEDLVIWADDASVSAGQMQKAYDWRIAQWASFANATLTAIFALLSSALIESYKESLKLPHFWSVVGAGTLVYACLYGLCRYRIHRLRQEFLAEYTLLMEIA